MEVHFFLNGTTRYLFVEDPERAIINNTWIYPQLSENWSDQSGDYHLQSTFRDSQLRDNQVLKDSQLIVETSDFN